MRNFTKYPSNYIKAGTKITSQEDMEQVILNALNPDSKYHLTNRTFTNLVYYMSGYAPDATLGDFVAAYNHLKDEGLVDIPWD